MLTLNLNQNYPNPFNPYTRIQFQLPKEAMVKIEIYNMLGERIALLINERKSAGIYYVDFNSENLSSGVYYCLLSANEYRKSITILLLK